MAIPPGKYWRHRRLVLQGWYGLALAGAILVHAGYIWLGPERLKLPASASLLAISILVAVYALEGRRGFRRGRRVCDEDREVRSRLPAAGLFWLCAFATIFLAIAGEYAAARYFDSREQELCVRAMLRASPTNWQYTRQNETDSRCQLRR